MLGFFFWWCWGTSPDAAAAGQPARCGAGRRPCFLSCPPPTETRGPSGRRTTSQDARECSPTAIMTSAAPPFGRAAPARSPRYRGRGSGGIRPTPTAVMTPLARWRDAALPAYATATWPPRATVQSPSAHGSPPLAMPQPGVALARARIPLVRDSICPGGAATRPPGPHHRRRRRCDDRRPVGRVGPSHCRCVGGGRTPQRLPPTVDGGGRGRAGPLRRRRSPCGRVAWRLPPLDRRGGR